MIVRLVKFAYSNARGRALLADFWGLKQLKSFVDANDSGGLLKLLEEYCPDKEISMENTDLLLAQNYIGLGAKIAASLPRKEANLIRAYLRRFDVENCKIILRGLVLKKDPDRYHSLLVPCPQVGGISLEKLQSIRNLDELRSVFSTNFFSRTLFSKLPDEPSEKDLLRIELELDQAFWHHVVVHIQKLRPLDRRAAEDILGLKADLDRFNLVHRGWRNELDTGLIASYLPPLGTIYSEKALQGVIKAPKPEHQIAKYFPLHFVDHPLGPEGEIALLRRFHARLKTILTEPPFDISLPLAVVLFKELEKQDLQAFAGGIRIGRQPQQIKELMVTVER